MSFLFVTHSVCQSWVKTCLYLKYNHTITEKHDNQTNRKTFIAHQTNIYTDSKTDREEARNINQRYTERQIQGERERERERIKIMRYNKEEGRT